MIGAKVCGRGSAKASAADKNPCHFCLGVDFRISCHLPYYAVELGTHEGVRDNGSGGREMGVTTLSFVGFCRSQVENAAHSLKTWQQL